MWDFVSVDRRIVTVFLPLFKNNISFQKQFLEEKWIFFLISHIQLVCSKADAISQCEVICVNI